MARDKQTELMSSGAGLATAVALEAHGELGEVEAIKARGYWEQVWIRFRRDKVAIAGGVFIILLFLIAFVGAPVAQKILGHGPNEIYAGGLDPDSQLPVGPLTRITTEPYPGAVGNFKDTYFVLGADSQLGRDMFLRLLYGAQTSLEVALRKRENDDGCCRRSWLRRSASCGGIRQEAPHDRFRPLGGESRQLYSQCRSYRGGFDR